LWFSVIHSFFCCTSNLRNFLFDIHGIWLISHDTQNWRVVYYLWLYYFSAISVMSVWLILWIFESWLHWLLVDSASRYWCFCCYQLICSLSWLLILIIKFKNYEQIFTNFRLTINIIYCLRRYYYYLQYFINLCLIYVCEKMYWIWWIVMIVVNLK
jgi:hypothetical protein